MQEKSVRNRKRSKRRQIRCPKHHTCLDSLSPKYKIYVEEIKDLRQRGVSRKSALMLLANQKVVSLSDEWIECFWCSECQEHQWYYVKEPVPRQYELKLVDQNQWKQVQGVIYPHGNPSVSEFTRRSASKAGYREHS
jgi:hypothetical protein